MAGLARAKARMGEQRLVEADQRLHSPDLELAERAQHAPDRVLPVCAAHDQLGDHRVVERRDLRALGDARVDAHSGAARLAVDRDRARGGQEAVRDVLGVDAALDRVALQADVVLGELEALARSDLHLGAHDVDTGDDLGDRVLDLDPRVHLHEVVGAVGREQTLDRPGGAVPGGARGIDRDLPDPRSQLAADRRRRRLLDELLVAALDRAVALAEVDDVPVCVGEHLHLDVARILQIPLDVDGCVGEVRLPLALGRLERLDGLAGRPHDLHALAAAAGRRLDDQRIADLLADRDDVVGRADRVGRARDDRDACRLHRLARPRLRAHQLDRGGRRADPDEARVLDGARERRVLGQEAVARMDGLGARARRPRRAASRRPGRSRRRCCRRGRAPRRRRAHAATSRSTSE